MPMYNYIDQSVIKLSILAFKVSFSGSRRRPVTTGGERCRYFLRPSKGPPMATIAISKKKLEFIIIVINGMG